MARPDPVVVDFCKRYGGANAESLIVRLSRELIDECPTESGPSPLDVLGSIRNIRSRRSAAIPQGASCSGLLIPDNGGYHVVVNAEEPAERQWFSFAHEIAHTFFREVCPNVSQPSAEEEFLCDIGAAELTMPLSRFRSLADERALRLSLFDELKLEFGVSFEAAGRRAIGISAEVACLFVAGLARTRAQDIMNRGDPALRLVRWTPSPNWPYKGTKKYKNKPVDDGCLIAESFSNLESRVGRGTLGIPVDSSVYDLETRSYEYSRGVVSNYRQVVVLAKAA